MARRYARLGSALLSLAVAAGLLAPGLSGCKKPPPTKPAGPAAGTTAKGPGPLGPGPADASKAAATRAQGGAMGGGRGRAE
jgi:hypothetical protein